MKRHKPMDILDKNTALELSSNKTLDGQVIVAFWEVRLVEIF